jgi:hypothetical protein
MLGGDGNLGRRRDHLERAHHFVVLVLKDVAVPDVTKPLPGRRLCSLWQVELGEDARHHSRMRLDGVLPRRTFIGIRRNRRPCEYDGTGSLERFFVERPPFQCLELHQVNVNGVRIVGGIHQVPDFESAHFGVFTDLIRMN